jgi:uncharacterized protein involved in exopolysaccharide biosynthesis
MVNQSLQSINISKELIRWRKHLIIVGLIALVASVIFSGPAFIKPRFKSFAILYPINLQTYSQESPTENMIQLLESSDIQDQLIKDFNLYNHYKIDTVNNDHTYTDVTKVMEDNISVKKTEYESVEIKVYDTDPKVASAIVDSIISHMNQKARELQRAKTREILETGEMRLTLKRQEIDSLEKLEDEYHTKYGLLDFGTQIKEYSRGYASAMNSGNQRAINEHKKMLDMLAQKGSDWQILEDRLTRAKTTYNDFKLDVENLKKDLVKAWTYEHIITRPIPADKKSFPIRWLIVVVSVGTSVFLGFLILLFYGTKTMIVPGADKRNINNKIGAHEEVVIK